MLACLFYVPIPRLTGSISYGIQADTSDNEFFRMYKETLDAMSDALVPGAFLVDILPFRGCAHLSVVCRRALIDGDLPQSSTYLLGFRAYGSTYVRKR